MRNGWLTILAVVTAFPVAAQMPDAILQTPVPSGEGWRGFGDFDFLLNALFNLVVAASLGAVIAYHPKHRQTADTLEEIEAAQIYILYAVIGSIIGILVVKYGMSVGFVLFGIGALIRFRTVLRSASLTGRLIFVTLIGLCCGLNIPHVAALITVFGFLLIYALDARLTYRVDVRALAHEDVAAAAAAYCAVFQGQGCRIISEKMNPDKGRFQLILRSSGKVDQGKLEALIREEIKSPLRGVVNWEVG